MIAYLNPGTTNFIMQILVSALVSGAFVARMFWGSIREFFKKLAGFKKRFGKE